MRRAAFAFAVLILAAPHPAAAQDNSQTLADIRQELSVLYVEMQKLKRELSTTGAPVTNLGGSTVLDRVAAMESELQSVTKRAEELENRVNKIVADGTNRIGDLEFRLCELEPACDVGQLKDATTLGGPVEGGVVSAGPVTGQTQNTGAEMAVGEEADFQAANKALAEGDNGKAAELFARFGQSYPGSPLAPQAELSRGKALDALGDTREAARAYLASFSANNNGPVAPDALYELGAALGRLGQVEQACITLGEVPARFPANAEVIQKARAEMSRLGCS